MTIKKQDSSRMRPTRPNPDIKNTTKDELKLRAVGRLFLTYSASIYVNMYP